MSAEALSVCMPLGIWCPAHVKSLKNINTFVSFCHVNSFNSSINAPHVVRIAKYLWNVSIVLSTIRNHFKSGKFKATNKGSQSEQRFQAIQSMRKSTLHLPMRHDNEIDGIHFYAFAPQTTSIVERTFILRRKKKKTNKNWSTLKWITHTNPMRGRLSIFIN